MHDKTLSRVVELSVFGLLAIVITVWGSELDWRLGRVDRLALFPLLGMIAFATMWWHFLVGFVRRLKPDHQELGRLHLISAYWVFAAFALHPVLLVSWGQDNDYQLLSLELLRDYAGPDSMGFITLGLLSLTAFIAFDIARVISRWTSVKRIWPFIDAASDVAFIGIWLHSLGLGRHVQEGWFRVFWILLGLSGIGFIIYKRFHLSRHGQPVKPA